MIGKKFGRLTIIKKSNSPYWECLCKCGNKKLVRGYNLKSGSTKSCGCYRKMTAKKNLKKYGLLEKTPRKMGRPKKVTNHGFSGTRFHKIWKGMTKRCTNKNSVAYRLYGEKGIKVCKKWSVFETFKDDMYESYLYHVEKHGENNTTIERIRSTGDYKPSNCKWATYKEQARNVNKNLVIEYNGDKKCLAEWCEIYGLNYQRTRDRIQELGWSVERAFDLSTIDLKKIKKD